MDKLLELCLVYDYATDKPVLVAAKTKVELYIKVRDAILIIDKDAREAGYDTLLSDYLHDIIYTDTWFTLTVPEIQSEIEDIQLHTFKLNLLNRYIKG